MTITNYAKQMNKYHSGTNALQKDGQMAVLVQIYRGLLLTGESINYFLQSG